MYTITHVGPDKYLIELDTGSVIVNFKGADVKAATKALNRAMVHLPLDRAARDHIRQIIIKDRQLLLSKA